VNIQGLRLTAKYHGDLGRNFQRAAAGANLALGNEIKTRADWHLQVELELLTIAQELTSAADGLQRAAQVIEAGEKERRALIAEKAVLLAEIERLKRELLEEYQAGG
jgi:hypothetical protein